MKYLAILRDSFREAIDSKVIYALVILSLLVTLFMLSMSFTPLPAEEVLGRRDPGGDFPNQGGGRRHEAPRQVPEKREGKDAAQPDNQDWHQPKPPAFQGIEVIKGQPDSPDSEYRITFFWDLGSKQEADKVRLVFATESKRMRSTLGLDKAEEFEVLKVTDLRLADGNANKFAKDANAKERERGVYFEVDTEPTPATRRLWPTKVSLFFGAVPLSFVDGVPLGLGLYLMSSFVLWMGSLVTLLISIIITAFFIPNMLRKGTVDLLVVKPIHRWAILIYKYIGGLTFVFITTTVSILGIWLALGLRSGIWANSFLLMIFVFTFFFAILYAVSTLAAVLTRSAIVAILLTIAAWFVFFVIGTIHGVFDSRRTMETKTNVPESQRWGDNTFGQVVRAVHFVTPRTSELDALGSKLLLSDFLTPKLSENIAAREISWAESIGVSLAYIVLFVGISCWWFSTKDY